MQIFSFKNVLRFQAANGLVADGVYGKNCKLRAAILSELEDEVRLLLSEVENKDLTYQDLLQSRPMASAIQEVLRLSGYDIGVYGADGHFGATSQAALDQYIMDNVLSSKNAAVNELALTLFKFYGGSKHFRKNEVTQKEVVECKAQEGLTIEHLTRKGRARVIVSDGEEKKEFTQFKKGYYTQGNLKMSDLDRLDFDISLGAWRAIESVSNLEGRVDAINTWDNSFMSLGMFQWTLGSSDDDGELGDLLQRLKDTFPDTFEELFSSYGIDVEDTEVTIEGEELEKANKDILRSPWWCFRFWKAAHDEDVQSIMLELSVARLRKIQSIELDCLGKTIGELFHSELALAECLQIHVNRPAYLDNIVTMAIREAKATVSSAAKFLTNGEEFQNAVLMQMRSISETYGKYPVTDALHRFDGVKKYFDKV